MSKIQDELNKYSNKRQLHQGGQKEVFSGELDGITYVLKKGNYNADTLERMRREVNELSTLNNEFYPRNHGFFIEESTKEFLIIEQFIENIAFDQLRIYLDSEDKLIHFFLLLIEALDYIWSEDIIHRDLKPENILIRPSFRPVIIDLGIARFTRLDSITQSGFGMGPMTALYAAPEFISNDRSEITYKSDFFSLGIYLIVAYTGTHPFQHNPSESLNDIVANIYKGNRIDLQQLNLSTKLIKVFNKMTENKPFARHRTVDQLITDIREI
jgi:serine/threonine-protein kinase